MEAAVVSPFLAASLEDQERLCHSISSILHQCTRGYSSLVPASVVDKLVQVLEDDGASQITRVLAYEVIWCVLIEDSPIVTRVITVATKDLKSTGTPDVTLAALDTLSRLPVSHILSFMLSADIDKAAANLLGPDSLPVVRGKASTVFTALAFRAWLLAESFVLTDAPVSSFPDAQRKRQEVQDRVTEMLITIVRNAEDDAEVISSPTQAALLDVFVKYRQEHSENAGGQPPGGGLCFGSEAAAVFVRNLSRRLLPRVAFIIQRGILFRSTAFCDSLRLLTEVFAHVMSRESGSGSVIESPLSINLDNMSSTKSLTMSALVVHAVQSWFIPALSHTSPVVRMVAVSCISTLLLPRQHDDCSETPSPDQVSRFLRGSGASFTPVSWTPMLREALSLTLSAVIAVMQHSEPGDPTVARTRVLAKHLMTFCEGDEAGGSETPLPDGAPQFPSGSSASLPTGESVMFPSKRGSSAFGLATGSPGGGVHSTPAPVDTAGSGRRPSHVSGSTTSLTAGASIATRFAASGWYSSVSRHLGRDHVEIPPAVSRQLQFHGGSQVPPTRSSAARGLNRGSNRPSTISTPSTVAQERHIVMQSPGVLGLDLGQGVGTIVSGSSDPVTVEVRHGVRSDVHQVILHVSITNTTRFTLPDVTFSVAVHGPASFVESITTRSSCAVAGAHTATLPLSNGLPAGSTVCWDQPLSVHGLGEITAIVSCRIVAPVSDSVAVVDDDAWDEWGADSVVPAFPEPTTTRLSFEPYTIPMSSLLIPVHSSGPAEFKSFVYEWQRFGRCQIIDAVSEKVNKDDLVSCQPQWLFRHLNTLGWHVVPWPDTGTGLGIISAGFSCNDWDGHSILAVITAELRPSYENTSAFVSSDESVDNGDATAAVVPSVFSAKSRSALHLASVVHGNAAGGVDHGSNDLLGLFDVFTPTIPLTEPTSPYPFQTPVKTVGSVNVLSSPVRPLSLGVPPPSRDDSMMWRVRLEVRSDDSVTMAAFAAGISKWFTEFTNGRLKLIRHYSAPPSSSCRQSWQGVAWDSKEPGLFSLCGIGRPPVAPLQHPVVALNAPVLPPFVPTIHAPPPIPPVTGSHTMAPHDPHDPFGGLFGGVPFAQPPSAPLPTPSLSFDDLFPGFVVKK